MLSIIRTIIEGAITMEGIRTRKPSMPGDILKALYMEPLHVSITELAERLGVSRKTVSAIVNGRAAISFDMALRLSRAFCTTPDVWLNLQRNVDLWEAEHGAGAWKQIAPIREAAAMQPA